MCPLGTVCELVASGNKIMQPKVWCPLSDFGRSLFECASVLHIGKTERPVSPTAPALAVGSSSSSLVSSAQATMLQSAWSQQPVGVPGHAEAVCPALATQLPCTEGAPWRDVAWRDVATGYHHQSPAVLPMPIFVSDTTPEEELLRKVAVIMSRSGVTPKPVRACQFNTVFETQFLDLV